MNVLSFLRFNLIILVSTKSQGNFSEVREKSGKMKVEEKWPPCLMTDYLFQNIKF